MRRRNYLKTIGAGIAPVVAGCTGGGDGGGDGDGGDGGDTGDGDGDGGGGGGDGGGGQTAQQQKPQSLDDLPPKENFEEYKAAWLDLAGRKAKEEGGEITVFSYSDPAIAKKVKKYFAEQAEPPFSHLTAKVPLGNNDEQLRKYAQSVQAEEPVVDLPILANLSTLHTQGIGTGQMDDIPAFIRLPDNLKKKTDDLGDLAGAEVLDRGINYNTDSMAPEKVSEHLTSWGDLLKDEWSGTKAIMDFTFNPSIANKWLKQDYTAPDGSSLTAKELATGVKENLDFEFVASATEGAAMVARGDAAMQLQGVANFIVSHRNDGLPVDHVRAPDTLIPYANPLAVSAVPNNKWSAKLGAQAYMTKKPLVVHGWGMITPTRTAGGTHPELGSSLELFEGSEIQAPFKLENPGEILKEYQRTWGAPI